MTTKKDIESALMRGADTLRDTIDAANYKDYVLPVMFVKYLSDSYTDAVEELSKQYSGIRLERQKKYLPFMVAEGCSFYDLYQQRFADNIGQLMNAAMRQIEVLESGLLWTVDDRPAAWRIYGTTPVFVPKSILALPAGAPALPARESLGLDADHRLNHEN